jgi:uncharacterized OB-fold protein
VRRPPRALRLDANGAALPAIGFQMAETHAWVRPGMRVDAVYRLQERRGGYGGPEAVLVDLRAGPP